MYTPAYTSVPARTTLAPPVMAPPMVAPPAQTPQQKAPRVWPESVRRYVQRAFAEENTIDGISKSEVEVKLKSCISAAAEQNQIELLNWDSMETPQQMIQRERMGSFVAQQGLPYMTPMTMHDTNPRTPENSRKRKSGNLDSENDYSPPQPQASTPPWRSGPIPPGKSLDARITQPSKRQKAGMNIPTPAQAEKERRKQRFQQKGPVHVSHELDPETVTLGPVVGRNQKLEKKYLRLTSAPNPDMVRPLSVLQQTLDLLKSKWKQDNDYSYICDQFKSLRQDLTVQHIKNDFTVNVYEIHARIALEKGDLGEYNQCQTQLQALYAQKLGGHPIEFKAYRILYFLFTCSRSDMNDILADLTPTEKKEPAIKHALDARSALALGNYHRFFRLYAETPNMGAYLLDKFVVRERLAALASICKVYKPDVKLRFISEELGFESDHDACQFICEQGNETYLQQTPAGDVQFLTGKVGNFFDEARKRAFGLVDLKGQI